jgi:hypothetical protein
MTVLVIQSPTGVSALKRAEARAPRNWCRQILLTSFLFAFRAQGQEDTNEIPQIRPLHAELMPTYWEQHGGLIIALSVVVVLAVSLLIWLATRPRPAVVIPPEILAREALRTLPANLKEGAKLSRVSQILREYLREAFKMPKGELTTTEFCLVLSDHPGVGPKLAGDLTEFLRDSDRRKFSLEAGTPRSAGWQPALDVQTTRIVESQKTTLLTTFDESRSQTGAPVSVNAVTVALSLIEKSEARRAEQRAIQTAGSASAQTKPS